MRRRTLAALFALASSALAQPPATPGLPVAVPNPQAGQPPVNPNALPQVMFQPGKDRLDWLLLQWELAMSRVQALHASNLTRFETDPVSKSTETWIGEAKYERGDPRRQQPDRAMLYMKKQGSDVYQRYVFNGRTLYEYQPQQKVLRVHALPPARPGQNQFADDNFLSFLFGMKAIDVKTRYGITLRGEDANYAYLIIEPKVAADRAEFTEARIALFNRTYVPREFVFRSPNNQGQEIKWDLPKVDIAPRFSPADFQPPAPEAGWTRQDVNHAQVMPPPASKVRPAGQ